MDSNGNSMPKRSWPDFSRRRYWPPDPSDHFLEMSRRSAIVFHGRPKIEMCENWVRHPRGGLLGHQPFRNRRPRSSESKPMAIRCRDGVGQIFHEALLTIGSVRSFVELNCRSCAVIALKLGYVRSGYVAVGSLVGPLSVPK